MFVVRSVHYSHIQVMKAKMEMSVLRGLFLKYFCQTYNENTIITGDFSTTEVSHL